MSIKIVFRSILLAGLALILTACSLPFWPGREADDRTTSPSTNVTPGEVAVINSDVIVTSPLSNETIKSPLTIQGRTQLDTGTIFFVIKDVAEQVMATSSVSILDTGSNWNPYTAAIEFPPPISQAGWLEVYSLQTQAEGLRDVVRLPVVFEQFKSPTVKIYFQNTEGDPNFTDCSIVYPVEREVTVTDQTNFSSQLVNAALNNLIAGPTETDKKNGFISQLPAEGIRIQKIEVAQDAAGKNIIRVDFNQTLQTGVAGSCRVTGIRAQITQTIKQFPGVDDVVISIDGKTEDILQP